jgi:hypothetical protein
VTRSFVIAIILLLTTMAHAQSPPPASSAPSSSPPPASAVTHWPTGRFAVVLESPHAAGYDRAMTRVLERASDRFALCHERVLEDDPNANGSVSMRVVVGPRGTVVAIAREEATSDAIVGCAEGVVHSTIFPTPGDSVVIAHVRVQLHGRCELTTTTGPHGREVVCREDGHHVAPPHVAHPTAVEQALGACPTVEVCMDSGAARSVADSSPGMIRHEADCPAGINDPSRSTATQLIGGSPQPSWFSRSPLWRAADGTLTRTCCYLTTRCPPPAPCDSCGTH